MRAGQFVVKFGPLGPERVVVNGGEVTDLVEWVNVFSQHGQAPAARIGLKPGVSPHEIKGDGVIEVTSPGNDLAQWLSDVDVQTLEEVVLERSRTSPLSGGSPVAIVLTILRELAAAKD